MLITSLLNIHDKYKIKYSITSEISTLKIFILCLLLMSSATYGAEQIIRPASIAVQLTEIPKLDGVINSDPAWRSATPMTNFWQVRPVQGAPASQKSEVYVAFTKDTLYIAAMLFDQSVSGILVTDSRRDSELDETDSFQVVLDTYKDGQNGLVFGTNPAGIQYDGQVSQGGTAAFGSGVGGFNLNWDTNWEVQTKITPEGWSLEMAIPFKSLRYGADEIQTWGINFQRNIRRNNEIAYWAPLALQHNLYRVSDAGSISGIKVPSQRNLKITPYGLGKSVTGGSRPSDTDYEFGFDVKYSITPSLTLDVTYNTDFAQVEADELQVNLDRFSIFLPEQRPFFLENADQFIVGQSQQIELFFSRRIGIAANGSAIPITGGLRVSGKIGDKTNVGFLTMRSDAVAGVAPENDYTVARVNREFGNNGTIGAIFVNREGDGSISGNKEDDYNRTYAIDGRMGIGANGNISGFLAKTKTPGLTGKDHSFRIQGSYNSEKWINRINYAEVGADFNPEVGFLRRRDYRHLQIFSLRRYRPKELWGLHELRPHISYSTYRKFDGYHTTSFTHVDNHWEWRNGYEVHTGMNFFHEGVQTPFDIVSGVTVDAGEYDDKEIAVVFTTDQSAQLSLSIGFKDGGLFGGDRFSAEPSIKYRVGDKFTSELSWNHNNVDLGPGKEFTVDVARLRMTYSFTPKMALQALVQYDKRQDLTATNLRFSWLVTGDSGLYIVYNEVDDGRLLGIAKPRKEFILKYSYLFDLFK
ncbi:MAG: hypothetical protein ACI9CE_001215 [Flavobacterium sp.]|jgi:hypothetical protein